MPLDTCRKFWFSDSILKCIKKKKRLYLNSLKIGTPDSIKRFRQYRNSLNRLILHEKQCFYDKRFEDFKSNGNVTWSLLRGIINGTHNKRDVINLIKENTTEMSDPTLIAKNFNNYFVNVGRKVQESIKNVDVTYRDYLKKMPQTDHVLKLRHTNEVEVDRIIQNMKPKKSSGHDGISNNLLKLITPSIRLPLSKLINISIDTLFQKV